MACRLLLVAWWLGASLKPATCVSTRSNQNHGTHRCLSFNGIMAPTAAFPFPLSGPYPVPRCAASVKPTRLPGHRRPLCSLLAARAFVPSLPLLLCSGLSPVLLQSDDTTFQLVGFGEAMVRFAPMATPKGVVMPE